MAETFKSNLCKQIEKQLDPLECNTLLSTAVVLDPRFKKLHFSSPRNAAEAITRIKVEVKEAIKTRGSPTPSITEGSREVLESSIWLVHEKMTAKQQSSSKYFIAGLPTELKLYLQQPILPRHSNSIQF